LPPMLLAAAASLAAAGSVYAQESVPASDDELRVYAVNVAKKAPLKDELVGYGIYLGGGKVLTAAHVVRNWPALTHPRVRTGLELPTEIVKQGSLDDTDIDR